MIDYKKLLIDEICKHAKERISKGKDYHYNNGDVHLFVQYFEDTGNIQINMRIGYDLNGKLTNDINDLKEFLNRYL